MSLVEFIGFVIMMVASVILSFKRSKEKREAFEDDPFEEEKKPQPVKHKKPHKLKTVKHAPKQPELNSAFDMHNNVHQSKHAPAEIDETAMNIAFDMHKEAFSQKKAIIAQNFMLKKSLKESIIMQEILNKPKGW